jgi:cytochrome b pre-mRNA-processing protein 3
MQRTILASSPGPSLARTVAAKFRKNTGKLTDTYVAYGISKSLFDNCTQQANYTILESQRPNPLTGKNPPRTPAGEDLGIASSPSPSWWFDTLGLAPTFSTWSQVTYLHLYILVVRLRALPDPDLVRKYQQYVLDHFSHAAEEKMTVLHGMTANSVRTRYLKDLFLQWRGLLASYDEGLVKGDAVLAAALWRNLWKGDEEVDWVKVAMVVGFTRNALKLLARVADEDVLAAVDGQNGDGVFESATNGLGDLVARQSQELHDGP